MFVERDREALAALRANLAALGFEDRATVVAAPIERALRELPHAHIAFCDPPYADDPWPRLLAELRADLLVGHAESPIVLDDRWVELRRRDYGRSRIVIAERVSDAAGPDDGGSSPPGKNHQ